MHRGYTVISSIVCLSLLFSLPGMAQEIKIGELAIEIKEDNAFTLKAAGTTIIQDDHGYLSVPNLPPINFITEGKTRIEAGKNLKKVILTWEKPEIGYFQRWILLFPKECIILWNIRLKPEKERRGNIGFSIPEELVKERSYRIIAHRSWAQQEARGRSSNWEKDKFQFHGAPKRKMGADGLRLGFLELYTRPRLSMEFAHSIKQYFFLQKSQDEYLLNSALNHFQTSKGRIKAAIRIKVNPKEELREGKNAPQSLLELADEGETITLLRNRRYLFPGEKIEIWAEYIAEEEKAKAD